MLKTMGIILRVLAVILLIGFIVGGVFAGKFVTWFRSGRLQTLPKSCRLR